MVGPLDISFLPSVLYFYHVIKEKTGHFIPYFTFYIMVLVVLYYRLPIHNLHSEVQHTTNYLLHVSKIGMQRKTEQNLQYTPHHQTNLILLLILAGYIEVNPGPKY